jgi:hypothetical protein
MFHADHLQNTLIVAFAGKHVDYSSAPKIRNAFLKMACDEFQRARSVQKGFLAHQTALEDQQAFSEGYRMDARNETWVALRQLEDVRSELVTLIEQAATLPEGNSKTSEQMQIDLDYARCVLGMSSGLSRDNHIFYKVNWSLDIHKTGAIPLKTFWIPAVDYYLSKDKNLWSTDPAIRRTSPKLLGFTEFLANTWDLEKQTKL